MVSGTDRTLLAGADVKLHTYDYKYNIDMSDAAGLLAIETKGVNTEIRHYDAGGSMMETQFRVNGGGNISVGGQYSGSLFLEKGGGGTYAGMNINNSDELALFSGGGDVVVNQPLRPDGGIKAGGTTGLAGNVLVKDGSNQLAWATLSGGWAGSALSDLDMNGFAIVSNAGQLKLSGSSGVNIDSNENVEVNANADGKMIQLNASGNGSAISLNANAGDMGLNANNMMITGNSNLSITH